MVVLYMYVYIIPQKNDPLESFSRRVSRAHFEKEWTKGLKGRKRPSGPGGHPRPSKFADLELGISLKLEAWGLRLFFYRRWRRLTLSWAKEWARAALTRAASSSSSFSARRFSAR